MLSIGFLSIRYFGMVSTDRGVYLIGGRTSVTTDTGRRTERLNFISKFSDGRWSRFRDLLTGERPRATTIAIGNNELMIFGGTGNT